MAHTNYVYRILHRPASHARVLINGVMVYDREPDKNITPLAPMTHWLVKGDNAITIELEPRPPSPLTPYMGPHFAMMVALRDNLDDVRYRWEFPDDVATLGLEPKLPWVHPGVFRVEEDLPTPIYLRGSREEFPVEGTPEQHQAVKELYDAFATRDAAGFEAAMELKESEFARFYEPHPLAKAEAMRRLNAPWVMDPFDEADLRFDRYADGRVAHVRRASGRPAVRAVHRDEPYLGWGANFYMTRLDGRWRIFW